VQPRGDQPGMILTSCTKYATRICYLYLDDSCNVLL
jgi:hypothetical protein